jgi:hypothetical protein
MGAVGHCSSFSLQSTGQFFVDMTPMIYGHQANSARFSVDGRDDAEAARRR